MVLWLRFMWAGSGAPNYQTNNKMIDKRMKKIAIALAGAALCLGACQQDGKTCRTEVAGVALVIEKPASGKRIFMFAVLGCVG